MELNKNKSSTDLITGKVPKDQATPDEHKAHDHDDQKETHPQIKEVEETDATHMTDGSTSISSDVTSSSDMVDAIPDNATEKTHDEENSQQPKYDALTESPNQVKQDPLLDPITAFCNTIYEKNSSTIVPSSLKQIAKILQAITKKPADKKLRQIRADNIIVKKYITSVIGATELMTHLGFTDETIDGKLYKSVAEDFPLISKYDAIASYLNDFKYTNPPPATGTISSISTNTPPSELSATKPNEYKPQPCKNSGCSYFGTFENDFYCSVCAKTRSKPISVTSLKTAPSTQPKLSPRSRFRATATAVRAVCRFGRSRKPKAQVQVMKDRCWSCNRKLGITGTECRCGYIFCGKHRYADEHQCTFDHYARHQAALEKANQKVKSNQFDNISP